MDQKSRDNNKNKEVGRKFTEEFAEKLAELLILQIEASKLDPKKGITISSQKKHDNKD